MSRYPQDLVTQLSDAIIAVHAEQTLARRQANIMSVIGGSKNTHCNHICSRCVCNRERCCGCKRCTDCDTYHIPEVVSSDNIADVVGTMKPLCYWCWSIRYWWKELQTET